MFVPPGFVFFDEKNQMASSDCGAELLRLKEYLEIEFGQRIDAALKDMKTKRKIKKERSLVSAAQTQEGFNIQCG